VTVTAVIASTAAGRITVVVCSAALGLLLVVVAVLSLGAAFASRAEHRNAARRTLLLLLRLAPWYRSRG
jgi:hypothetical protein